MGEKDNAISRPCAKPVRLLSYPADYREVRIMAEGNHLSKEIQTLDMVKIASVSIFRSLVTCLVQSDPFLLPPSLPRTDISQISYAEAGSN